MKNVLVLYPTLFNCYSKFSRKVVKIISTLEKVSITFSEDPNEFILNLSKDNQNISKINKLAHWSPSDITHAIIFDDGEEFQNELILLKSNNVPLRVIKIAITRVINIKVENEYQSKKSTPFYEYIGRGSYWGNPYSMYEDGNDRSEVIRKYKYDFDYEKFPNKERAEVFKLTGKKLGCFCKPLACHGDILADYLNSWDDGK
jgi:hypothetical protein